eukprot:3865870-Rhodomonas_salina.2
MGIAAEVAARSWVVGTMKICLLSCGDRSSLPGAAVRWCTRRRPRSAEVLCTGREFWKAQHRVEPRTARKAVRRTWGIQIGRVLRVSRASFSKRTTSHNAEKVRWKILPPENTHIHFRFKWVLEFLCAQTTRFTVSTTVIPITTFCWRFQPLVAPCFQNRGIKGNLPARASTSRRKTWGMKSVSLVSHGGPPGTVASLVAKKSSAQTVFVLVVVLHHISPQPAFPQAGAKHGEYAYPCTRLCIVKSVSLVSHHGPPGTVASIVTAKSSVRTVFVPHQTIVHERLVGTRVPGYPGTRGT